MPFSRRGRTERLISIGRVVLAVASLLAVWLEPLQLPRYTAPTYALLVAYVVYAIVMALALPRVKVHLTGLQVATHAVDLVWIAALIHVTEGATSPFVLYLVFVLVAATLRWSWRGALWTSAAILVGLAPLNLHGGYPRADSSFELDHFIVLCAYVAVLGVLLAFWGLHESRLRDEVGRLAVWSRDWSSGEDERVSMAGMLERAAGTMAARRVLLAWEQGEEPWLLLAYWDGHRTDFSRAPPNEHAPLVVAELEGKAFLCAKARWGRDAVVQVEGRLGMQRRRGVCVNPSLADRFEIDQVVSVPVELDQGEGRLFFLGKARMSSDDLTMAQIIGRGVSMFMAEARLRDRLRESAALEERVRLARDLHDGVLQSLAGTALRLETARRLLESDVAGAARAIEDVQRSLTQEQRDMRFFVDTLTPARQVEGVGVLDLRARLAELRESVSNQWGLEVEVVLEEEIGMPAVTGEGLTRDVTLIVHEGLVNSARHARATWAKASVRFTVDHLRIVIEDDGRGFPFQGRYGAAELRARGLGPVALMERVERRGGELAVVSGRQGSRIEITLPLRPDGSTADGLGRATEPMGAMTETSEVG